MKMTRLFMPTLREVPAEAEIISHQLMLRAALIRQLAAGIYSYLPLGWRTLHKVQQIVREEMDRAGAQELMMSAVLPAEAYQASGRWDVFGPEMFQLQDRNHRDFCLGPTHEEIFTDTVKSGMRSYRDLPMTLYQIQNKYRDEKRPRFGLMRCREFIMKDAYSFDRDEAGLDVSYQAMNDAYRRTFDRCKLQYLVVDADSGAMGGSGSQEFMVTSDVGEATIAACACGYAANDEKAPCPSHEAAAATGVLEMLHTPNVRTIEDLLAFFGCEATAFAKTLLYDCDGEVVAVMVRGDREVNETKLKNLLRASEVTMADAEQVEKATGAAVGFAGPLGLTNVKLLADYEVVAMAEAVIGANKSDYHYKGANALRDFPNAQIADLRNVAAGDLCPVCGKALDIVQGIEVGHIFKLGSKYTEALECNYLDENGQVKTPLMGCYGIGVGRTMAAVIEQNHDADGIIWPMAIAPYEVLIVPTRVDGIEIEMAMDMYRQLQSAGIDVLIDDREERPGVKFKDADLLGIPVRVTVGKKAGEGLVEYKRRSGKEVDTITAADAIARAIKEVQSER